MEKKSIISSFNFVHIFHFSFQQLQSSDIGLGLGLVMITNGISNLFVYCFFGKLATESFLNMSNCLYESNWPDLPVKLQMYMVIMIRNTENPLYYHGFGLAVLDLETFTTVNHNVE